MKKILEYKYGYRVCWENASIISSLPDVSEVAMVHVDDEYVCQVRVNGDDTFAIEGEIVVENRLGILVKFHTQEEWDAHKFDFFYAPGDRNDDELEVYAFYPISSYGYGVILYAAWDEETAGYGFANYIAGERHGLNTRDFTREKVNGMTYVGKVGVVLDTVDFS